MSVKSEDADTFESFWEPRNYRRTIKRIEDGYKLSNDLIQMVQERAEVERDYSNRLRSWTKKWSDSTEKGPEYGSMAEAWKSFFKEAEDIADVHTQFRGDLSDKVISCVRNWQRENYHKKLLGLKECKDMEEEFKKVQKPWEKLLAKVSKAKQDFFNASKAQETAVSLESKASSDLTLPRSQIKKLEDKTTACKEETDKCLARYKSAIAEVNASFPTYVEDMRNIFEKCQQMEAKRMEFFKQTLFEIHKLLDLTNKEGLLRRIYQDFHHQIENSNPSDDLKWWSQTFGADATVFLPISFEDYPIRKESVGILESSTAKSEIIPNGGEVIEEDLKGNPFEEKQERVVHCSPHIVYTPEATTTSSNPFETDSEEPEGEMEKKDLLEVKSGNPSNPFEEAKSDTMVPRSNSNGSKSTRPKPPRKSRMSFIGTSVEKETKKEVVHREYSEEASQQHGNFKEQNQGEHTIEEATTGENSGKEAIQIENVPPERPTPKARQVSKQPEYFEMASKQPEYSEEVPKQPEFSDEASKPKQPENSQETLETAVAEIAPQEINRNPFELDFDD